MPEGFARIRRAVTLALALVVTLALGGQHAAAPRAFAATQAGLAYTQAPCAPVSTAPKSTAPLITQLLGGTDVTLLGAASGWSHVRIWGGMEGYIPASALAATPPAHASEGNCSFPGVPDPQVDMLPHDTGPFSLTASGATNGPATLYAWPSQSAAPVVGLAAGASVSISQWAGDTDGQPWYHVATDAGAGWIWAGNIRLSAAGPRDAYGKRQAGVGSRRGQGHVVHQLLHPPCGCQQAGGRREGRRPHPSLRRGRHHALRLLRPHIARPAASSGARAGHRGDRLGLSDARKCHR